MTTSHRKLITVWLLDGKPDMQPYFVKFTVRMHMGNMPSVKLCDNVPNVNVVMSEGWRVYLFHAN